MTNFAGIFEVLASDQHDARVASRKALVLSRDRLDARLGKFLLASRNAKEFAARYDLVAEDFEGIVRVAASEVGHHDPNSLISTLRDHYERLASDDDEEDRKSQGKNAEEEAEERERAGYDESDDKYESSVKTAEEKWIQKAVKKPGDLHKKLHVPEGEKIPEEKIEEATHSDNANLREKAQFAENVKGLGKKKKKKGKKSSSVRLSDEGNTGLDGPSPKMDKQRWTPKSVRRDEYDGGKNEIGDHKEKDILEVMPKHNLTSPAKDVPETGKATEEKLPSASNYDDAGFASNNQDMAPHTKTFGDGGQVDPVQSESLEG